MAFPTSISSGHFSTMAVSTGAVAIDPVSMSKDETTFVSAFDGTASDGTYEVIGNIREIPPVGTPSNIVNVPVYGQSVSSQVQAQADAPDMTLTVNYVPSEWDPSSTLGAMVRDGNEYLVRMTYLTGQPDTQDMTATGIGTVPNATWFMVVRFDAIEVQNSMSDSVTATISMSLPLGRNYGPFTV